MDILKKIFGKKETVELYSMVLHWNNVDFAEFLADLVEKV